MKTYPDIDPETIVAHYGKHIVAMTVERLESKADIAAQLALRDQEIERLQAALAQQPQADEVTAAQVDVIVESIASYATCVIDMVWRGNEHTGEGKEYPEINRDILREIISAAMQKETK